MRRVRAADSEIERAWSGQVRTSQLPVPGFTQVTNFSGVLSDLRWHADKATTITPESIAARIESLPSSQWNQRIAVLLGAATFFDAFDALTVAFIMPSILLEWHLSTINAAWLVSAGYAGQAVGAVVTCAFVQLYVCVPCGARA